MRWIERTSRSVSKVYEEEIDVKAKNIEGAWEGARELLDRFNATLKPGENGRRLIGVEILSEDGFKVVKITYW